MLQSAVIEVADGLSVRLAASGAGIRTIELPPFVAHDSAEGSDSAARNVLRETETQLRAYFAGHLRIFQLPLDLHGSEFQLRVWRALCAIPYGETRSYLEIAITVGSAKAVRAVGAANGANPVPIVVPCHRVIGANGKLVGYGGGLSLKQRLLELESGPGLFDSLAQGENA